MDEKNDRQTRRRRLRPGFVLNVVCLGIILICFVIGGIQAAVARSQAAKQAQAAAAALAAQQEEEQRLAAEAAALEASKYDFTLAFMGDVNLDDSWATMQYLAQQENGIEDCISADLLQLMQDADLFCVNSEFAFTDRGEALPGKAWTFRSKPENVSIYQTMGVDLVSLANNHVYDFGPEGLTDTLTTLDGANIPHVGAGENLADASKPYYTEIGGKTIGFVNASNAENTRYTPEATEDSSGILLCYEPDKFLAAVGEAKSHADYVVALVHWGDDYVYETSEEQRTLGHQLIDAGADVIIGTHSHCIQGIEYYNGKPIFYGLGSCWFNGKELSTYMLQIHFVGDANGGDVTYTVLPGMQTGCTVHLAESGAEAKYVTDLILKYSDGIWFENYVGDEFFEDKPAILHDAAAEPAPAAEDAPEAAEPSDDGDGTADGPEDTAGTDGTDEADLTEAQG